MTTQEYGVLTTVDSSAAAVAPFASPIIGGIVGTAVAPVQGANPNAPGTLPDVNTPISVRSLAEAYAKGIGVGSLLSALTRIFVQTTATIILIRTADRSTAAFSVPFFAMAEDHLGFKANWIGAPGFAYVMQALQPILTLTGVGSGATFDVTLDASGGIISVDVIDGGMGYSAIPAVVVTDPDGNGTGAVLLATVTNNEVDGITVSNGGSAYGSGDIVPILDGSTDVLDALQMEAEHEGIHFVSDIPPLDVASTLTWLVQHPYSRGLQVANQGSRAGVRYDGSAVALGCIIRNEAEHEVRIELPSSLVLRVRTSPSNKIVNGITGAYPEYVFLDRYQDNPANVLRFAGACVITHKEGNWKLWGSDTNTLISHEPLADVSVLRVVDQLTDDLDYEWSFYVDEPMTQSLVESALERGQSVATAYVNAGLMDSGTTEINEVDTNFNTGDMGFITLIQIAGVVHRIHNRIHLQPL